MSKIKHPRAAALAVAKELCDALKPVTERLIVAGSLRRRKPEVGDVEILFIPKIELVKPEDDFFAAPKPLSLADVIITVLVRRGILAKRENVNGSEMWGPKNKLALHVASGIPVDLFTACESNWFNYLVCRTGGKDNNTAIATAAQAKGWKWHPYAHGFTDEHGNPHRVTSEQDVFTLAGLPYREPWDRL